MCTVALSHCSAVPFSDNPLILHISSLDMLAKLYPSGWQLPPQYTALVAAHWPGPLTILLPRSAQVPAMHRPAAYSWPYVCHPA